MGGSASILCKQTAANLQQEETNVSLHSILNSILSSQIGKSHVLRFSRDLGKENLYKCWIVLNELTCFQDMTKLLQVVNACFSSTDEHYHLWKLAALRNKLEYIIEKSIDSNSSKFAPCVEQLRCELFSCLITEILVPFLKSPKHYYSAYKFAQCVSPDNLAIFIIRVAV
jgi:hypothetical protein